MPETRKDNRGVSPKAISARERWQQSKRRETRRRIRDNALKLFAQYGYDNVTVHQIAELSEVTPITLFRYFPKKEDCILSIPTDSAIMRQLRTIVLNASKAQKEPGETVRLILEKAFASLACGEMERLGQRLDVIRANETLLHALYARFPVWRDALVDQLNHSDRDEFECRLMASIVVALVIEVLITWSSRRQGSDISDQTLLLQTAEAAYQTVDRL